MKVALLFLSKISYFVSAVKGVNDDPYRPCFQCESFTARDEVPDYAFSYIDRQAGEKFQVTQPRRRVVCRRGPSGQRLCRLRISRAMQLRQTQYASSLQFVQAERYLSTDDLDILKYYKKLRRYLKRRIFNKHYTQNKFKYKI